MGRVTRLIVALVLAGAVFLLDQGLKSLVENSMRIGESINIIPNVLDLTYIKNSGGAFGILEGQSWLLLVGSAIAVGAVLRILLAGASSLLTTIGCGLLLGGAAGNLLDRLSSGEVTDYIHFRFWYIFNAADAGIVIGVVLLLISALLPGKAARDRSTV